MKDVNRSRKWGDCVVLACLQLRSMPAKIRDILRRLREDGWYLDRTRRSHRQFKHPVKSGVVTIAWKDNDDLHPKTLKKCPKTSREEAMKVLIIVEETGTGYSAYAPDLPGCIATGRTRVEVEKEMQAALEFHLQGMRAHGEVLPESHSYATVVDVASR